MLPACFSLADEVFPAVRAEAARVLVAQGQSQSEVASQLGVSQAMVSKYLARPTRDDPLTTTLRDELLQTLAGRTGTDSWCAPLAALDDPGHAEALRDLLSGEALLRQSPPIAVVPEVGLNLARAPSGATRPDQILGFPGRLVAVHDRLVRPAPPVAGGSGHLARCLLARQSQDPSLQAVGNLRGDKDTRAAAEAVAPMQCLAGDDPPEQAAAQSATAFMHHPGAVGLESCLYVFGPTATDVARTILTIQENRP